MNFDILVQVAGISALAVVAVQEILKLKIVPFQFANRFPVPTNIALSIVASLLAVWQTNKVVPVTWQDWLILVALISVTAAIVYNQLIGKWAELRQMEG